MTPQEHARAVANRTVGATIDDLTKRIATIHDEHSDLFDLVIRWHIAYDQALDQAPVPEPLLTIKDVAATLVCSETTVRELIATGRLPAVPNLGRLVRVRSRDVRALIEGKELPM